jgi:hypothetical protein
MLIVETKLRYPKALIMLFDESDKDASLFCFRRRCCIKILESRVS